MMPRKNIRELMVELRSLSGIASRVLGDNGVDWFIPSKDVTPEAEKHLQRVGHLYEEDDAEKAAAKHTVKGKIEVMAERITGLSDFVDNSKFDAAATALAKIMTDMESLHKEIEKRAKDQTELEKKEREKEKEAEKETQQQQPDVQQAAQAPPEMKKPESPVGRLGGAGGAQAAPAAARVRESVYIVGGEVITGAGGDPFGLGDQMLEEIRIRSGLAKQRKKK